MKDKVCHVISFCSLLAAFGFVRAGDALPLVDLSGETNRHVIVAAGETEVDPGAVFRNPPQKSNENGLRKK